MKKFTGRRATVIAASMSVLLVAGVAFAAWTATGSGSGNAKATTAQLLTTVTADVSTLTTTPDLLYPGDLSGKAKIKIHNPNAYPVTVTDITHVLDATHFVTSDVATNGCTDDPAAPGHPTGVAFVDQSSQTLAVPAGGTVEFTLNAGSVTMSNSSDNNCQGATFTIPVSLLGHSG